MTRLEACMTKQNAKFELVLANDPRWMKTEQGKKGLRNKGHRVSSSKIITWYIEACDCVQLRGCGRKHWSFSQGHLGHRVSQWGIP